MKLKDVIKGSNFTQGDKFLSTFQILIFASVFSNFGLIKFILACFVGVDFGHIFLEKKIGTKQFNSNVSREYLTLL